MVSLGRAVLWWGTARFVFPNKMRAFCSSPGFLTQFNCSYLVKKILSCFSPGMRTSAFSPIIALALRALELRLLCFQLLGALGTFAFKKGNQIHSLLNVVMRGETIEVIEHRN